MERRFVNQKKVDTDVVKNFCSELRTLLNRYDAVISFTCDDGSDTHGLSGDTIVIEMGDIEIIRTHSWYLNSSDLK